MGKRKTYLAIDLKSFYASVECVDRGLDPLTTNLVVADKSRTNKTICLAVSPALKAFGIPGRPRLFEVEQKVQTLNATRRLRIPKGCEMTKSCDSREVNASNEYEIDYIVAPPRMARYMEVSAKVYQTYLKFVSSEDIHVYSIDEVFIDATPYLETYHVTGGQLARMMILAVLDETGITATAGIGTNLYLCKVAMDIVAKHIDADKFGVRIAELDEMSYRYLLWAHQPLTDFWRVGRGYARKLENLGLRTMGDIARCSLETRPGLCNEQTLYKLFGINAELLIDHAWGYEPCSIADIKAYRPDEKSVGAGQVLQEPYTSKKARIVVREMADALALDLFEKGLVTNQLVLTVGYDIENLVNEKTRVKYTGEIAIDHYGRRIPKSAHGTWNLSAYTALSSELTEAACGLFDRIINQNLLVRRITMSACHVIGKREAGEIPQQASLFDAPAEVESVEDERKREQDLQDAVLAIKRRFGKNAILRGTSFQEGATGRDRNRQIGGHKA